MEAVSSGYFGLGQLTCVQNMTRFLSPHIPLLEDLSLDDNESPQQEAQKEFAELLQAITNRHKQGRAHASQDVSLVHCRI